MAARSASVSYRSASLGLELDVGIDVEGATVRDSAAASEIVVWAAPPSREACEVGAAFAVGVDVVEDDGVGAAFAVGVDVVEDDGVGAAFAVGVDVVEDDGVGAAFAVGVDVVEGWRRRDDSS